MRKYPVTVKIALGLLVLDSVLWLGFAVVTVLGFGAQHIPAWLRLTMAGLSLILAAGLGVLFYLLIRKVRIAYWISLALIGAIAVVSLMDELGVLDISFCLFNLILLALLIKDNKWYLKQG